MAISGIAVGRVSNNPFVNLSDEIEFRKNYKEVLEVCPEVAEAMLQFHLSPTDKNNKPSTIKLTVTITPIQAAFFLNRNYLNRGIRENSVKVMAANMREGSFQYNGETIKLNALGELIDGQHRLSASVKSGTPFRTDIAVGVPSTAFTTIDTGDNRRTRDIFDIMQERHPDTLASVTRLIDKYQHGKVAHRQKSLQNGNINDLVAQHPYVRDSVEFARRGPTEPLLRSVCGFLHFIGSFIDSDATEEFLTKVRGGENLSVGNPAFAFRNFLISPIARGFRRNQDVFAEHGLKALSAYLSGTPIKVLRIKKNESWPKLIVNGKKFEIPMTQRSNSEKELALNRLINEKRADYVALTKAAQQAAFDEVQEL